jgi:predicted metalloprotease with PDZ domain
MKRVMWLLVSALTLSLAAPAFAGDYKCTKSTQECLDYMVKSLKDRGWIGVEVDNETGQLMIAKVMADSPAKEVGLQKGDVLMAVNGVAYSEENNEKLAELKKAMMPGKTFTFTFLKAGKSEKDIDITLDKLPDDVLAQWIGKHMLEHAGAEQAEE